MIVGTQGRGRMKQQRLTGYRRALAWALVAGLSTVASACGDEALVVAGVVRISDECTFEPDRTRLVASPRFDIATGGTPHSDSCERPFVVQLLVDNVDDATLAIDAAQVTLRSVTDQVLDFGGALPNPHRLAVVASLPGNELTVVPIEVIPAAYAEYLDQFEGQKVMTDIVFFKGGDSRGSTTVGVEICSGCLTRCESEASDAERDNACNDAALGPEAVLCIDPEC